MYDSSKSAKLICCRIENRLDYVIIRNRVSEAIDSLKNKPWKKYIICTEVPNSRVYKQVKQNLTLSYYIIIKTWKYQTNNNTKVYE